MVPVISDDCRPFIGNIDAMLEAPYFKANGMRAVSVSMDEVVVEMECSPGMRNSNGFIHGGALYGAMDHTHAILANIRGPAVGQSANVQYFRPARADVLRFRSRTVNESKSLHYTFVEAFEGEKLLASGTFCAFKIREVHG